MGACVNRETGFEVEEEYEDQEVDTMNERIVTFLFRKE